MRVHARIRHWTAGLRVRRTSDSVHDEGDRGRSSEFFFHSVDCSLLSVQTTIPAEEFPRSVGVYVRGNPVTVQITPNEALPVLDYDYSAFQSALRELDGAGFLPDRSIQSFIEVLTTHCLIKK